MKIFDAIFAEASKTYTAQRMRETVEDSPWHREANVWVHTEMVLAAMDKIITEEKPELTHKEILLCKIAALFHDVGKPQCEKTIESKERGVYRAYHGHEQRSARLFEDFFTKNAKLFLMDFNMNDFLKIMFMIEFHLPFNRFPKEQADGRQRFARAIRSHLGSKHGFEMMRLMMRADNLGRISDNAEAKIAQLDEYLDEVKQVWDSIVDEPQAPVAGFKPSRRNPVDKVKTIEVKMLLGCSGAGKSSMRQKMLQDHGGVVSSGDDFDMAYYKQHHPKEVWEKMNAATLYQAAFNFCEEQSGTNEFQKASWQNRKQLIEAAIASEEGILIFDFCHYDRKSRRCLLANLKSFSKQAAFKITAYYLPSNFDQLVARFHKRKDRGFDPDFVRKQFFEKFTLPIIGEEVDEILAFSVNM